MQNELLTWAGLDPLIDHLIGQIDREIDMILMLNPGGIVVGGILVDALKVQDAHIAKIDCCRELGREDRKHDPKYAPWPKIGTFPRDEDLNGKTVLIVAAAWGTGRCISAVRGRVVGAGGEAFTAVLHYDPGRSIFTDAKPDYYAAVTSNWIVYPWEGARGTRLVLANPALS